MKKVKICNFKAEERKHSCDVIYTWKLTVGSLQNTCSKKQSPLYNLKGYLQYDTVNIKCLKHINNLTYDIWYK